MPNKRPIHREKDDQETSHIGTEKKCRKNVTVSDHGVFLTSHVYMLHPVLFFIGYKQRRLEKYAIRVGLKIIIGKTKLVRVNINPNTVQFFN